MTAAILDYLAAVGEAARTVITSPERRWRRLSWLLVWVGVFPPLWAGVSLCLLLDRLLFPGFRKQALDAPLFVVGNHRTGSTFLHRLLAADDETFATFHLWQLACPSVLQQRLVGLLARVDRAVGGPLAAVVRFVDARWATDYRKIHAMGIGLPEEDEYVLFLRLASGAMWETFPDVPRLRRHFWSDTEMDPAEQDGHLAAYRAMAQRRRHVAGRGTWLSKNPLFSTRVRGLRRAFPDARFLFLTRDPRKVVGSTASLLHAALDGVGALSRPDQLREMVFEICDYMYRDTLADLSDLPPERLVIVRQEDLITDLEGTVRGALSQLGLPWTEALSTAAAAARQRGRSKGHRYTLEDFGFTEAEVLARYDDVCRRWGYGAYAEVEAEPAPAR